MERSGRHAHSHGRAHTHRSHAGAPPASGTERWLRIVVVACGAAIVVGAALLWPSRLHTGDPLELSGHPLGARVTAVEERPCATSTTITCVAVRFTVTGGEHDGETGELDPGSLIRLSVGDRIRVDRADLGDGQVLWSFFDFQRTTPLLWLAALFAAAVIALGRWRGVGALVGLAASLLVIVWFALPSLVEGHNAVAVALVTTGAVAIVALYLAHGVNAETDVALLSTLASLALTGVLAWIFVRATELTGYTDEASFVLDALGTGVDARGILLAGIVIGSLGVLDDVTVTQVAAVRELHDSDPARPTGELFRSAMTIGRDHISSTVNTLFLAYAGAALPLLLLFTGIGESVGGVATREIVAVEIVRALVGSIGLVASVPISTWLALHVVPSTARRRATTP